MNVRCRNGHIWETKVEWEELEKQIVNKVCDISCPECKEMPIAEVTVKKADKMGNYEEGRKFTEID